MGLSPLSYAAASHQLTALPAVAPRSQGSSLRSPTLAFPRRVHTSVLHVCVSVPVPANRLIG